MFKNPFILNMGLYSKIYKNSKATNFLQSVTSLGKKNSLAGGDYFTDFHTRNNTPNAATAVSRG